MSRKPRLILAAAMSVLAAFSGGVASAGLILQLKSGGYTPGAWTDSSGFGNNASQGTAGLQPLLVAGQTPNGGAVVRFDGIDDYMALAGLTSTNANGFSVFVYGKATSPTTYRTFLCGQSGAFQYRLTSTSVQQLVSMGVANRANGSIPIDTNFHTFFIAATDASSYFRLDGAADGLPTNTTSFNENIGEIGERYQNSSEYLSGDIAEIRVYDSQFSTTADIQAVEQELKATWQDIAQPVAEPGTAAVMLIGLATLRRKVRLE